MIGTEAVLHRPELRRRRPTLVAFLDLDQELLAPRYRAAARRRTGSRRAARNCSPAGRASETRLARADPPARSRGRARAREGAARRSSPRPSRPGGASLGFPPFGALAEISGDDAAVLAAVDVLRGLEVAAASVQVLGPTDGRALVVAPTADVLADALGLAHAAGRAAGRVRVVVDPPRV